MCEDDDDWSEIAPSKMGPYWMWAEGRGVFPALLVIEDGDTVFSLGRTGYWTTSYAKSMNAKWHAWQAESPAPPKVDPGAGVWTDRPFAGGPHRLSIPQGHTEYDTAMPRVLEVNVLQSDEPWTSWTFLYPLDERACLMSAGNVLSGARWYRYPEPPVDVRARVRPEARDGA